MIASLNTLKINVFNRIKRLAKAEKSAKQEFDT